jgi:hypothetical protein
LKNKKYNTKNKWKKKKNNYKLSSNKKFKNSKINVESWKDKSSPACPLKAKTSKKIKNKFKTSKNNFKRKENNIKRNKKTTRFL